MREPVEISINGVTLDKIIAMPLLDFEDGD